MLLLTFNLWKQIFITALLFIPLFLCAQNEEDEDTSDTRRTLTQPDLNKVLNRSFSHLLSSNPSPGEIATYASLDPINANFTLKGSFPFQPGKRKRERKLSFAEKLTNDSGRISYLSLSISGGLIDKKYASLFSNSVLNSGVSFEGQYNFRLRRPKITYSLSEWSDIALRRNILFSNYHQNKRAINQTYNEESISRNMLVLEATNKVNRVKVEVAQNQLYLLQKTSDSLGNAIAARPGLVDSLAAQVKNVTTLFTALEAGYASIDSLQEVSTYPAGHKTLKRLALNPKLQSDYDSLLAKVNFKRFYTSWVTILGGYTRKSFAIFDTKLPFESQIDKDKLDAFNFGIALNILRRNKLRKRTFFYNLSLSYLRNNNLANLSTSTIDETRRIVNASGDIVRQISSKHTVYTSPIETFNAWNVSAHAYWLFGKTPMGVHLFPSLTVQDNDQTLTNITLGYLLSFVNTVKDQPRVNAELFVRFNDVFNDLKADTRFLKRNEIGIAFTLPFNIF